MKQRIEVLICDLCPPERATPAWKTATIGGLAGGTPFKRDLCRKHAEMLLRKPEVAPSSTEKEDAKPASIQALEFGCEVCGRTFTTQSGVGMHKYRMHDIVYNDEQHQRARERQRRRLKAKKAA